MNNIKESVRKAYGKIASAPPKSSCCGSGASSGSRLNYDAGELAELQIADLNLGCGNPAAFADLREGMKVLDLGSGAGIDVFIAAEQIGATGKAIGIDMTPEMISRAKENAARLGFANTEFRLGEIESMPVADDSIDRVISNCVINLVPDKARAFREIYRVLKPGGSFVISDIVTTGVMPETVKNDPELWCSCIAGALEREEYIGTISSAGFTDITVVSERKYADRSSPSFGVYSITVRGTK